MEKKTFQNKLSFLLSQRNALALCVLALSIAVVMLSVSMQNKEERVVVIPTTGPSFWVEKSRTSEEYLRVIGVFLTDLLLTRTPGDVTWKNDQVLGHAHPQFYSQLKKALNQEKEKIVQNQSTLFFEATHFFLRHPLECVVEGKQKVFIETAGKNACLVHTKNLRYILSFRQEEGRLYLTNLRREEL